MARSHQVRYVIMFLMICTCGFISGISAETVDSISQGKHFLEKQDYTQALKIFDSVIEKQPDDAYGYVLRSTAYHGNEDNNKALQDVNKAINLNPDYDHAYFLRGNIYQNLGEWEEALLDYHYYLKKKPKSIEALLARGRAYFASGHYKSAITDADQILEIDPKHSQAYVARGGTHSAMGNLEAALEDYEKAIQYQPMFSHAYFCRGADRFDSGDLKGAISDYNEALRHNPDYYAVYIFRAAAYLRKGDSQKALADCIQALGQNCSEMLAYLVRGQAHYALGHYQAAYDDFNSVIKMDATCMKHHTRKGRALLRLRKVDEAIDHFNKALKEKPRDGLTYLYRSYAFALKNQLEKAVADNRKAQTYQPHNLEAKLQGAFYQLVHPELKSQMKHNPLLITTESLLIESVRLQVLTLIQDNQFKKAVYLLTKKEQSMMAGERLELLMLKGYLALKQNNTGHAKTYFKEALASLGTIEKSHSELEQAFPEILFFEGMRAEMAGDVDASQTLYKAYAGVTPVLAGWYNWIVDQRVK